LENAIKKHAGSAGSAGAAFTGKGQTLSGSAPTNNTAANIGAGIGGITNIDPQVKLFLGLIGVYLVLWYFK